MQADELQRRLRELAKHYATLLQDLLQDKLVTVALFGSVARREASATSDIDLLIVIEELPGGQFARKALLSMADAAIEPQLASLEELGVSTRFARILKTRREAAKHVPLYLDMVEDAVLLFDRDGFFARVLADLKARLERLGSRRRRLGKIRYWDLKPDFRPGEEFEI